MIIVDESLTGLNAAHRLLSLLHDTMKNHRTKHLSEVFLEHSKTFPTSMGIVITYDLLRDLIAPYTSLVPMQDEPRAKSLAVLRKAKSIIKQNIKRKVDAVNSIAQDRGTLL